MSRTAAYFHRTPLTIWPVTFSTDGYNTKIPGAPFIVMCNYSQDNKSKVDSDGVEFIPKYIFYVTATRGQIQRNSLALLGNHLSAPTPPNERETIRDVQEKFVQQGLGTPDITVFV